MNVVVRVSPQMHLRLWNWSCSLVVRFVLLYFRSFVNRFFFPQYSSVWKWVPKGEALSNVAQRRADDTHLYVLTRCAPPTTLQPPDYYKWDLPKRASQLNCTVPQLCKGMLMENKSWKDTSSPKLNARFYLVVVQYCSSIDAKRLESEVRTLLPAKER